MLTSRYILQFILVWKVWVSVAAQTIKPDLSNLFDSARACHIHLIEYSHSLDHSQIRVPFILTSQSPKKLKWEYYRYTDKFCGFSSCTRQMKIAHMICSLEMFLLPGKEVYNGTLNSYLETSYSQYMYTQACVVSTQQPNFLGKFRVFLMRKAEFSESLVNTLRFYTYYDYERGEDTSQKAVKIYFLYERIINKYSITEGRLIVQQCEGGDKSYKFSIKTTDQTRIWEQMNLEYAIATDGGNKLCWQLYQRIIDMKNVLGVKNILGVKYGCPFNRKNYKNIKLASYNYLLSYINQSLLPTNGSQSMNLPYILSTPEGSFGMLFRQYDYFVTGYSDEFVFITSDGVFAKATQNSFLLSPFQPSVWYTLLGVSIFILLFMTTAISQLESRSVVATVRVLIWLIIGAFLEKSIRIRNHLNFGGLKLTAAFLFLAAVIMSNAYKGMVKSNSVVTHPYDTKWQHLQDLVNFSFFSAIDLDYLCSNTSNQAFTVGSLLQSINSQKEFLYSCLFGDQDQSSLKCLLLRHTWQTTSEVVVQERMANDTEFATFIQTFLLNQTLLCPSVIPYAIQSMLSKNTTAFVTLEKHFDYYWSLFKTEMDKNPDLAYSHNRHVNEMFLKLPQGFKLSTGWNSMYQKVPKRVLTILSSGIYWFWEKWEQRRVLPQKYALRTSSLETNAAVFRVLSMSHSTLLHIFCVLGVGSVLASVCFLVEIAFFQFSLHRVNKIEKPFLEAVKATLGDRYTDNIENIYKIAIQLIIQTLISGFDKGLQS